MSKGARQALFMALAAVVIVAVGYTIGVKTTTTTPANLPGAQAQQQQDQVDPATLQRIKDLEAAIKTDPKDVAKLSELGQVYFDAGQLDKSISTFVAALQIEPNNAELHTYLGFAYFWNAQAKEAIAEYKKATELDPKSPEAYYNLALAQSHSQPADPVAAAENWQKVIALAPGSDLAKKSQDYIDKYKSGATQTATPPAIRQ